ncbi:hypothetical protein CFP56_037777 [Quercus suber]|uniref:Uncharacterized protein n=1 Tax=Quercus suber TaxID=58331 RepID=A0AAW0J442_QUESU
MSILLCLELVIVMPLVILLNYNPVMSTPIRSIPICPFPIKFNLTPIWKLPGFARARAN